MQRILTNLVRTLAAHWLTAVPPVAEALRRASDAAGRRLLARIQDPVVGEIAIRAIHHEVPQSDAVVLIVHGIGGTADSGYCVEAARAAVDAGCSAVRISLRGADGNGDDIYHAGLTDDLRAVLSLPQLRRYRRVFLIGYSQGGNIALRAAQERIDPRIAGVAAICPPLDLRAAMENFDRRRFRLHKWLMNSRANESFAAVERRGRAFATVAELRRARTCAEWNELTIGRRFGFRSANHYYQATSVPRDWRRLRVPALLVFATHDPVVPRASIERALRRAPANVQAVWRDLGGHIHFPRRTDLENQAIAWLIRHDRSAAQLACAV